MKKRKKVSAIGFEVKNSQGRLVRFTTPFLDSIIPTSTKKLSPWNTPNYYFYEIANKKGEMYIQLYFYCRNLSDEMKDTFTRLAEILDLGELSKGYMLFFKSSVYHNTDEDTPETIFKQLDRMFSEVNAFENSIYEKWDNE